MSNIKVDDLPPAPFFARFLEGQFSRELTAEEMKAVSGGSAVTMAAPSDQEGADSYKLPDMEDLWRLISQFPGGPGAPGGPAGPCGPAVTMAYPSDGESTGNPF